jgi:hypothetical protein
MRPVFSSSAVRSKNMFIAVLRVDLWRATGAQDAFVSPLNPGRLISCEQWS